MKSLKDTLAGMILLVYGHMILIGLTILWSMFNTILWNKALWVHVLIASVAGFLFYGTIGFLIGRLDRKRTSIRSSTRIFWGLLTFAYILVLILVERNLVDWTGYYNLTVYPLALFFKNASMDLWIRIAFFIVLYISYRGVLTGFSFQRRLMRLKGSKR